MERRIALGRVFSSIRSVGTTDTRGKSRGLSFIATALLSGLLQLALIVTGAQAQAESFDPDPRRLVKLEGAHNFRDLGGYETRDGRTLKWGLIYRSDNLHELTDADLQTLAERDLRTVIDFRSLEERTAEPNRIPPSVRTTRVVQLSQIEINVAEFVDRLLSGEMSAEESRQFLLDNYIQKVREGGPSFGEVFTALASGEKEPLLFHCTAGKDRTGLMAAVLLSALGVPRDVVADDYVITEHYRAHVMESELERISKIVPPAGVEALKARLARREYILAALEEIDREYGGIDAYVRDQMGIDDNVVARLRALYLE